MRAWKLTAALAFAALLAAGIAPSLFPQRTCSGPPTAARTAQQPTIPEAIAVAPMATPRTVPEVHPVAATPKHPTPPPTGAIPELANPIAPPPPAPPEPFWDDCPACGMG